MKLDLTSFEKAINSLIHILQRYQNDNYDIDIRDAVIQRFEYTYSLAIKVMIRFLKIQMPDTEHDLTFNEIIRNSNKYGLLQNDIVTWTQYRQKRNLTSHTYDETIANDVLKIIPEFIEESKFLLEKLKETL